MHNDSIKSHFDKLSRKKNGFVSSEALSYVMKHINPEQLLMSLGIRFIPRRQKDKYIIGWCPDHFKYTKRMPSHPKWYFDVNEGTTYCYTEQRKSNIISVIKNILNLNSDDALEVLKGKKQIVIPPDYMLKDYGKKDFISVDKDKSEQLKETLDSLMPLISEHYLTDRAVQYFAKDGITKETLDRFEVCEVINGRYKDRALVPFYNIKKELVGFAAINLLDKKSWVRSKILRYEYKNFPHLLSNYRKMLNYYKKVLFCPNSNLAGDLFGIDKIDFENTDEVILVEGERDAIKLQQMGFPAVATHGNRLSIEQVILLKQCGVSNLILAYDGDNAGRNCAKKIMVEYKSKFFNIWNIDLPDGIDPKDCDKKSFLEFISFSKR